jgi:hypothetical protein
MDPPDPIEAIHVVRAGAIKFPWSSRDLPEETLKDHRHTHPDRRGPKSKARALDRDDPTAARMTQYRQKC